MSSLTILIWSLSLTGFFNSNRAMLLAIVLRSYPGCTTILFTVTGVSVPSSLLRLNSPEDKYRLLNNWTANKKTKQKDVKTFQRISMHFLTNKAQTIRLGSIRTLWLLSLDERLKLWLLLFEKMSCMFEFIKKTLFTYLIPLEVCWVLRALRPFWLEERLPL